MMRYRLPKKPLINYDQPSSWADRDFYIEPPEIHGKVPGDLLVYRVKRVQDDYCVGRFVFSASPFIAGAYTILNASLDVEYRGLGLGQETYLEIMKNFGPLHPDWQGSVSKDALRLWHNLSESPFIEKVCYPIINVWGPFGDGNVRVYFDIATEIVQAEVYRDEWEDYLNCVYLIKDQFTVGKPITNDISYEFNLEKEPYELKLYKSSNNIGSILFENSKYIDNAYSVIFSHVEPMYRGRGFAKLMYLKIIEDIGPLHPDWESSISMGAAFIWESINKLPNIEKECIPTIKKEYLSEQTTRMNMENGIQLIVRKRIKDNILNCIYRKRDQTVGTWNSHIDGPVREDILGTIIEEYEQGVPVSVIAAKYRLSENSVRQFINTTLE